MRPVLAAYKGLACKAAAIFAVAAADVVSNAVKVTVTPPTVILPGAGEPLKVNICVSPCVTPVATAMRLIAAAFAIALPAAFPTGETVSSVAYEAPILIPLIFKSPDRNAGMLPSTATL